MLYISYHGLHMFLIFFVEIVILYRPIKINHRCASSCKKKKKNCFHFFFFYFHNLVFLTVIFEK